MWACRAPDFRNRVFPPAAFAAGISDLIFAPWGYDDPEIFPF
jgi:hypothetical protein